MRVSWRNSVAGLVGLSALIGGISAWAQDQVVTIPGVTVGAPPNGTGSGCCNAGKSHGVSVPGVGVPGPNLVITPGLSQDGQNIIVNGQSQLQSGIIVQGADTRTTFLSNGSYIPMADPIVPSNIDLNVKGATQVREIVQEQVPVQEEVCVNRNVQVAQELVIRAVCMDDTGTPHPASRVDDSVTIDANYTGEVYRCMAGTSMQVTFGSLTADGADYSQSSGFSCPKGEALTHAPGKGLFCATQAPERNCNERSLLRRYGPGEKLYTTTVAKTVCEPTIQTRYETVQREVVRDVPLPKSNITLDGGVGQQVTY